MGYTAGMDALRRALLNLCIAGAAVIIAYAIGLVANQWVLG